MSGYAAGKMAGGFLEIAGAVLLVVGGLIVAASAFAQRFGPLGNAVAAAVIVYLVACLLSRKLLGAYRCGTVIAAALGGYLGALVYPTVGGLAGILLRGVITGVFCLVLMLVSWAVVDKVKYSSK